MAKASTSTPPPEVRTLKAHENLVLQVIKRQAGTLAKAVLEGVMNSIDAGANNISVLIKAASVTITDDGQGFSSADSIKQVFEVFGNPHEMNDEGISTDAKYGTFRIGRGQLFAFGLNTWSTNTFRMCTDINGKGLQYELYTSQDHQKGCVVDVILYDALSPRDVQNTVDEVTKLCRYVPQNLVVNGECVSKDPEKMKWDLVHELAYIDKKIAANRWRAGTGLDVYQQGVFVETIPASEFGMEGTVVIKKAVQINFARNQVIRSCGRWKKIAALLCDTGTRDAAAKKKLNRHEARSFLTRFGNDELELDAIFGVQCFPDTNGKMWSVEQLTKLLRVRTAKQAYYMNATGEILIGFGPSGCRTADRVMQQRLALVLDHSVFSFLNIPGAGNDPESSAKKVFEMMGNTKHFHDRLLYTDYTKLSIGDSEYKLVPPQELTPVEQDFIHCVDYMMYNLQPGGPRGNYRERRKICIGISRDADGWTDGRSYVAVNRNWLSKLEMGMERDWHKISTLIAHELCHNEPDSGTHNHTPEFYEDFHELALRRAADAARWCYQVYRKQLARRLKKLPKGIMNHLHVEADTFITSQLVYTEPTPPHANS